MNNYTFGLARSRTIRATCVAGSVTGCVPEAHAFAEGKDEALMHAVDALESALSMYVDDRRDILKPLPVKSGIKAVTLPALSEAKLAL